MSEQKLAKYTTRFLNDEGWDVYKEVQVQTVGPRADLVAVRRRRVWVVETKMNLNLKLLSQAWRWLSYAHFVSVAVPKRIRAEPFTNLILKDYGIGCLEITKNYVWEEIPARRNRKPMGLDRLVATLREEHKHQVSGRTHVPFLTPWKLFFTDLKAIVHRHPGLTLQRAIRSIGHTLDKSDDVIKNHVIQEILQGRVQGVKLERRGNWWRIWPDEH